MAATLHPLLLLLFALALSLAALSSAAKPVFFASVVSKSPFAAKASTLRYWSRKIPGSDGRPRPGFLVSKLSPLSALDSSTYSNLAAAPDALNAHLPAFCAAARLLCNPSLSPSLASRTEDANFGNYQDANFTNYGTGRPGGRDSFKNYSGDSNIPIDSFRRYSRDSAGHDDSFATYSSNGNVVTDNFTSYATAATGGTSRFSSYQASSNVPNLKFTNYDTDANGRQRDFTGYAQDTNSGDQSFSSYGKHGNGVPTTFTSYANNSNVINSGFSGYGQDGNGAVDAFTSYGTNGNVPENTFKHYGENGNAGTDTFTSYRDQSNVGDDSFASYAKGGTGSAAAFAGYGASFNSGSDKFKGYGEGGNDPNVSFKSYAGDVAEFKAYAKSGVSFKGYHNASVVPKEFESSAAADSNSNSESLAVAAKGKNPNNRWVEPGKFFRESELKRGTVMPMPDIRDKMPARSFLPRSIAARIPFTGEGVRRVFGIAADTALGKAVEDTVAECRRAPSRGETKRCATSAEDVIDFAAAELGGAAAARSTESAAGSGRDVAIGDVKGGKVTGAVSCHQSLFPYLVYYCHSVPKVRVYEAEILAVDTKERINRGVAICHLDTSDWSAGHGAFVALGSAPGKIEVCHWIFQGDMTWTAAD